MNSKKYILLGLLFGMPFGVIAISSTNYEVDPLNIGNSGGHNAQSTNFSLEQQQLGDVTVDESNSANFTLRHGHLYPDEANVSLDFTVIPEKRIPFTGNNGTRVLIYIYRVGGTVPLHAYSYHDTNNNGHYVGLSLSGIMPGTYDIAVKGYAHLRKRLNDVTLTEGINTVDFTFMGSDNLLCGDIYTNGSYIDGDNKVNSIDVTYLVSKWAINDTGVSDERADVDENGQVNSLDMTKTINNYAVVGD